MVLPGGDTAEVLSEAKKARGFSEDAGPQPVPKDRQDGRLHLLLLVPKRKNVYLESRKLSSMPTVTD